jgi:hypothetical protein
MKYVQEKDCTILIRHGLKRRICPNCKSHEQIDLDKFSDLPYELSRQLDCKEVIYKDELDENNKLIVLCQCNCYSVEHATDKDDIHAILSIGGQE